MSTIKNNLYVIDNHLSENQDYKVIIVAIAESIENAIHKINNLSQFPTDLLFYKFFEHSEDARTHEVIQSLDNLETNIFTLLAQTRMHCDKEIIKLSLYSKWDGYEDLFWSTSRIQDDKNNDDNNKDNDENK